MSAAGKPKGARILLLNRDERFQAAVATFLSDRGFRVECYRDSGLAFRRAQVSVPDLLICDEWMQEMSASQILDIFRADLALRRIPIVFLVDGRDSNPDPDEETDRIEAHEDGVSRLVLPLSAETLLSEVDACLGTSRLHRKLADYHRMFEETVESQVKQMTDAHMATIVALAKLAESRDDETGEHVERTRSYCRLLATQLSATKRFEKLIDRAFVENIFYAAALHDIGKVAISDSILTKPGKLTPAEFVLMKKHTICGAETLIEVDRLYPENPFVKMGIDVARHHHERWDGSGYPDGLSGNQIPIAARVMAVADVYDALRSKRPYKPAYSHARSREILLEERNRQFDASVVEAFLQIETVFEEISSRTTSAKDEDSDLPPSARRSPEIS